jgi:hypothetical protein
VHYPVASCCMAELVFSVGQTVYGSEPAFFDAISSSFPRVGKVSFHSD